MTLQKRKLHVKVNCSSQNEMTDSQSQNNQGIDLFIPAGLSQLVKLRLQLYFPLFRQRSRDHLLICKHGLFFSKACRKANLGFCCCYYYYYCCYYIALYFMSNTSVFFQRTDSKKKVYDQDEYGDPKNQNLHNSLKETA